MPQAKMNTLQIPNNAPSKCSRNSLGLSDLMTQEMTNATINVKTWHLQAENNNGKSLQGRSSECNLSEYTGPSIEREMIGREFEYECGVQGQQMRTSISKTIMDAHVHVLSQKSTTNP